MRTIDADALWKEFCKSEAIEERYGSGVLEIIGNIIDNAPTIDAVPLEQYQSMEATCVKLQKAIADTPQGWIPCSERLPDERQDVYVTVFWDDYGDTITAYGMRTRFGWSLWNTVEAELIKGYTVIAWIPLPKPWKGADDED